MKKCSKCGVEKELSEFYKNKKSNNGIYSICKKCECKKSKDYYQNNKEKLKENMKEYSKEYRENNKEKINEYCRKRREKDPLFKMISNLRNRTRQAFKAKKWNKNGTEKMLGCDWETAHKHLEIQFTKGMNWENQGEWHIDHIIPLVSANTKEELIKLCHYTNLQPLWAEDNLKKGATIPNVQTKLRI